MSKHLERDLESLERQLLTQALMVEEMIKKASRSLRDFRCDLVAEVMVCEKRVNEQEVQIEEHCLKILALHQPVAIDLRRTATILKINNDLERMADLAVNIAERAQSLSEHGGPNLPMTFDHMVEVTVDMVRTALDALVHLDTDIAREVCLRDDEVDDLNREVIEEMHRVMRFQPQLIESAVCVFSASRHVERIADHATNIAEDVSYLVDGEIARHKNDLNQMARSN